MDDISDVADGDTMAIWRSHTELAHSPRLVLDLGQDSSSAGLHVLIIAVRIRNAKVGKVAVTAEITRRHIFGAFAEHDHAVILRHKHPTRRLVYDTETQHVGIKRG